MGRCLRFGGGGVKRKGKRQKAKGKEKARPACRVEAKLKCGLLPSAWLLDGDWQQEHGNFTVGAERNLMKLETRLLIWWGTVLAMFVAMAGALMRPTIMTVGFLILTGFAMFPAMYLRYLKEPCLPAAFTANDPLWERMVGIAALVTMALSQCISGQGRFIVGWFAGMVLFLCFLDSDLRSLRQHRQQAKGATVEG